MQPRHENVHPAFDLSRMGYFLDFALVPIAITALGCLALSWDVSRVALLANFAAGVLTWSLAEYWIHRGVFHGNTPFEPMRQQHHALPKDMIGLASWATFVAFSSVWLAACMFAGQPMGSAVTAGVMAGYLFYCVIHVSMHHAGGRGFGKYGTMMSALHQSHHRGGKGNFGVSSPIWDYVFGTYQPSR